MDEKKKRLKFQNNIYLFIFIDKAVHANYLHNSRITISISLHPSIYPVASPPILVQFNHVSLSHGIMIPISTLLDNEINSVYDLKLQIILRDSLTSRLIGKCYIPFNLTSEDTLKNFKYYKEKDNEDLPFFFYRDSSFSIYSKKQQKEGEIQNKTEICQVILTIALGKESEKEIIMPSSIACQEQIRFKRNFSQSFYSPPSTQISPKPLNTKANSPLSESNNNSTELSALNKSNKKKEKNINSNTNKALENHIFFLSDNSQKRKLNINNNIIKLKPKSNNHIDIDTYKNKYKFKNINASKNKNPIFFNKINKNKLIISENLTDDQVQFVISNWEKYALQNGWIPPPNTEKEKSIDIKEFSPTRQKEDKPKFLGLLNRKLIPINQSNTKTNNISEENSINSNKNGSDDIQYNDLIDTNNDENKTSISFKKKRSNITVDANSPIVSSSSAPTSNKKSHRKKKNKSYFSQFQSYSPESKNDNENSKKFSSSSVVPQRTTQYQMINECKLDDDFPDKVQRYINSDPPPKLQSIDEYESEKTSTDEIELFETDSEYTKSVQSSPGLMNDSNEKMIFVSASSEDEFFFQSDPTGSHISPLMAEKMKETSMEDDKSVASERLFLSSPPDWSSPPSIYTLSIAMNNEEQSRDKDQISKELELNNELETNEENQISNDIQFLSNDQMSISESGKIDCKDENEIDITKSSFETLEEMAKIPPIQKEPHSNYNVSHFDNLFDSTPTVSFGEKEIISVTVFRTRPNPSEKLNTMYYSLKSSQKSKLTQKKDKIPPPLPLIQPSDSKTVIKRSPSLEKIFQDGFMDSGLNISGIYSDSSSE